MASVSLSKVSKSFAGVNIIKGVDLSVAEGEFVVFVGPSGCGKSTLLRMISGLEEISSGEIYLGDRRVDQLPATERDIAMVFQSYALYPHMTVAENIGFPLKMAGYKKDEIKRKVAEIGDVLRLGPLLDRTPKKLSGGQRQRVAIGRALARDPKIILLDEPLSNLDAALRVDMRQELSRLHRELAATMIYVTHDQIEAMTMADRIVVLREGLVEQVGSPLELYSHPQNIFVAGFIGSPKMNFLPAVLNVDGIPELDAARSLPIRVTQAGISQSISIGIRPEHLVIADNAAAAVISGQVLSIEHLGSDTFVQLDCGLGEGGGVGVNVRLGGIFKVGRGDQLSLCAKVPDCWHIFDQNGKRVDYALSG